jgi:hypothetical protein
MEKGRKEGRKQIKITNPLDKSSNNSIPSMVQTHWAIT